MNSARRKLWIAFAALAVLLAIRTCDELQAASLRPVDEAQDCAHVLRNVDRIRQLSSLYACMDFYFLNQDLDPEPGSFNSIIRLGYRVLELDRHDVSTYGSVSWLLWSKWANWKEDPTRMPDGQFKLQEALALLDRGEKLNPRSPEYLIEAANTVWPIAQHHEASLYPRVIRWYSGADALLNRNDKRKVRVRLNLGHIYRKMGQIPEARRCYQAVLEIDPTNAVALRILESLEQP
jgi:tetratricopeptide (TPR) repeat protein